MIPNLTDEQLSSIASDGEKKVYQLLKAQLPSEYQVLFQARWLTQSRTHSASDGEIDFVVAHPDKGFITIEVKGGGVTFDATRDIWTSTDRFGKSHDLKDPVAQALGAKHSIARKLREGAKGGKDYFAKSTKGHAVYFPDVQMTSGLARSDMPSEIVGTANHNSAIREWVDTVFDFWARDDTQGPGQHGLTYLRDVFAHSFSTRPLTSAGIQSNEDNLIQLTTEQLQLLRFISSHQRATILGGAGTGKTVLAAEKAQMLADQGYHTLLTCYNRPLADQLARSLKDRENIVVLTVHQLASRFIDAANRSSKRNILEEIAAKYPGSDSWSVHMPLAMWESSEILSTKFDAIICDEAQDIPLDFWMPLQNLLSDFEKSPFYIFKDDNQNIYGQSTTDIFPNAPFQLTLNCRNSCEIHEVAYAHYTGPHVTAPSVAGIPVVNLSAKSMQGQAELIVSQLRKMLNDPGITASEIVVLVSSKYRTNEMKSLLSNLAVSKSYRWTANHTRANDEILIETVKRFKGLESPIVLMWIDNEIPNDVLTEEIYVGASRARSQLVTISRDSARTDSGPT